MNYAAILAQVASEHAILFSYGPLGIICGWFMLRGEALIKEVRGYGHKIDGLRLALLANAAASDAATSVRVFAQEEIARIKAQKDK